MNTPKMIAIRSFFQYLPERVICRAGFISKEVLDYACGILLNLLKKFFEKIPKPEALKRGTFLLIFKLRLFKLRWTVEKNSYSSSFNHIFSSEDFEAIVELSGDEEFGAEIIKRLFRDLQKKITWETVFALGAILDYEPTLEETGEVVKGSGMFAYNLPNLAKGLIAEGKKRGYWE